MKLPTLFNRQPGRSLLIELNPYQVLAAGVVRRGGPDGTLLDCAAAFDAQDDAGLHHWLTENFEHQGAWVPALCSFVPPEGLLQRDSLQPRKLTDGNYLNDFVADQYKIENPAAWKLGCLSPLEGLPLAPEGLQRPALLTGVSHTAVHHAQQRLLDHRLLPYRLESGLLPLIGALFDYNTRRKENRATVVIVIGQDQTTAIILGKEGAHTPAPVRHGFSSIVQAARKEFDLTTAHEVRERLHQADEELLLRASRFVRSIGRELKSLIDSYEMTTGQPVGEIYCAYLPPPLAWIAEPLAQVVGRTPLNLNLPAWLPTVNIQTGAGTGNFAPHWLGALSLVADLPEGRLAVAPPENAPHQGAWRIDCRLSAQLPSGDLVGRQFLFNAIFGTVAACLLMAAAWLLYARWTVDTDIAFWDQRIADNRRPAARVERLTKELAAHTRRIDQAWHLVGPAYSVPDLLMALGRTRPPVMRLDQIESNPAGLMLRGALQEPPDQAARTLQTYLETLRADPAVSTIFPEITQTSVQRGERASALTFEIALRLKAAPGTAKP